MPSHCMYLFAETHIRVFSTVSTLFPSFALQTQSELASDPTMRHLQRLEEGQAHSQAQVRSEHKRYEVCENEYACCVQLFVYNFGEISLIAMIMMSGSFKEASLLIKLRMALFRFSHVLCMII
jgi:hypothetical protein